jgi:hypothetical protein
MENGSSSSEAVMTNGIGLRKAELATGPEVEKTQVELPTEGKLPQEVHVYERYAERLQQLRYLLSCR